MNEEINEIELSYIATALELGSDFQFVSKQIEECAFFLTAPEANGPPLPVIVPAVIRALREHAA